MARAIIATTIVKISTAQPMSPVAWSQVTQDCKRAEIFIIVTKQKSTRQSSDERLPEMTRLLMVAHAFTCKRYDSMPSSLTNHAAFIKEDANHVIANGTVTRR